MRARTFPRGVHPPELKQYSSSKKIEIMPPPEKVLIPLLQHFGNPAKSLVKKGDKVLLGQMIGEASTLFSAPVHASVSGKVLSTDDHIHPSGSPVPTVTIANDGQDCAFFSGEKTADPLILDQEEIRQKVKAAGIVGMGGAGFPTSVKLTPPKDKPIDTVIINGCECEPLLTADHRIMMEFPEDILLGAQVVKKAVGAQRIIIGIEDNKQDALQTIQKAIQENTMEAVLLKTKYPQGAEKNLVYALLNREVPRGGLPFDVGVVVQNVATVKAIWDALSRNKPLYERVITVSGSGICDPKNLSVRIGTSFQEVIDFCGGSKQDNNVMIMGGPMMGLAQWSPLVPVVKGTSGILLWSDPAPHKEYTCIRCARCVQHCPMSLVPTQLMKLARYEHLKEAEANGILDCVECGCCQYVCPAEIPLVHWIRLGKNQVVSQKRKKSA